MSFGDGGSKPGAPPSAAPQRILPETEKAKVDLRERLRRARSRAMSRVTEPGLMDIAAPTQKPVLGDMLGG